MMTSPVDLKYRFIRQRKEEERQHGLEDLTALHILIGAKTGTPGCYNPLLHTPDT